jgi:hypothetical protein
MKKLFGLGAFVALAFTVGLIAAPAASATPVPTHVGHAVTKVVDDPDSGDHGNWAFDTFTRTTDIYDNHNGTFTVNVVDSGSFTTLAGGPAPHSGLPLPAAKFTGTFNGSTTYRVVSKTPPVTKPLGTIHGSPGTSTWPSRFFPGNDGTEGVWSWTYELPNPCQTAPLTALGTNKWVDADTGEIGDIRGFKPSKTACPPPVTSTTTPPATTTTVAPTQTTTPATTGTKTGGVTAGSTGTGGSGTAQVVAVPVGAADTGGGGTATNNLVAQWLIAGAALVLVAAGFGLYTMSRRSSAGK